MEALAVQERPGERDGVVAFLDTHLQPIQDLPEQEDEFEKLDHQIDAWLALWEARANGETSALVTLATGLGKTSVAVFDVLKYCDELEEQEGREPRVLFVCHQDKILEQAAKRFDKYAPDMTSGFYTGEEKNTEENITFATFQSLYNNLDKFDPLEFDYIVYDEAHHSQADTWHRVVSHFSPSFQLALTATPDRMDGLEILDLFGREVYAKGLGEALAEGLLADVDYHIVFDEAVKQALEDGFHPTSLSELRRLLSVPRRNDVIAKNIREEMEKIGAQDAKTIVFCNDIAHANVMAKMLGGKAYHSDLKSSEKTDVLEEFKYGDLQIICTRDMFNEGIDIPDANLLVFLRSTQSKTVFEQQLGRGLRKHAGKEVVSVLDFVGNIKRLQEVLDLTNSVTALTSEHDLDQIVMDGDQPKPVGGKFQVRTDHTNFDFEKMAIDLLDTYQSLSCEPAPEGHMNVSAFARELGISYSTMKGLIAHHQIETGRHLFGNSVGVSLSPEAQDYIQTLDGFLRPAPEDYLSAAQLAQEYGIKPATLLKALKGHEVPLERHLYRGQVSVSFSPEAQVMVSRLITPLEEAPEGYVKIPDFARELGIEERFVNRLIRLNEISVGKHKFDGSPARSLSPEAQEAVRALEGLGKPIPEDYVTIPTFASEVGVAPGTITSRIKALGLPRTKHRIESGGLAATLSPEAQEELRKAYPAKLREAPEGYINFSDFRQTTGLGELVIKKAMEENEIEAELMYFGEARSRGRALSPDAQALLREKLKDLIVETAPEGHVSVAAFGREIRSTKQKLLEIIITHGIETGTYRFGNKRSLGLSQEAQAQLKELYDQERPKAPEGYLSVTGFADKSGIGDARLAEMIEEHGIETEELIFGVSTVGTGLSLEAQEKLLELRGERADAPEDYKSVNAIAKETGVSWSVLKGLIAENEIKTGEYTYRGSIGSYLDPEAQEQLIVLARARQVPELPEGYMSLTDFSKQQGFAQDTYERLAEESEVDPQEYKSGRKRVRGLSPDDQKKIVAAAESLAPRAPEGYVSLNAFAKQLRSSKPTLLALIDEHDVPTERHRFSTVATVSLSPATQHRIRELHKQSKQK